MQLFKLAIVLILTSILLNFKIGSVYISYLAAFISAFMLVFDIILTRYRITSKVLFYTCLLLYLLLASYILKVWASEGLTFYFLDRVSWPIYSKALLFFLYFVIGLSYFKQTVFLYKFLDILYFFVILFCIRFWIEGFTVVLAQGSNNIDSLRYYPSWIGGWNTFSTIIAVSIIHLITIRKLKGVGAWIAITFLVTTMIATQSRSGVLFLLIAIVIMLIKYRLFKISATNLLVSTVFFMLLISLPVVREIIVERFWASLFRFDRTDISYLQFATSGRTVQWFDFYIKFFNQENTFQYFTGYGLGHYGWKNSIGTETSMHNTFFQFIYDFGIPLGAFLFLGIGYKLLFIKTTRPTKINHFLSGCGMLIFLNLLVQDLMFVTQTIPIVAILFSNYFIKIRPLESPSKLGSSLNVSPLA